MTCLKASIVQGYLEEPGASTHRQMVESRLASCARCRDTFDCALATHRRVNSWLAKLSLPPDNIEIAEVGATGAMARVLSRAQSVRPFAYGTEIPWYRSICGNVRQLIRPEKLPPLELTSSPVAVKEIWGQGTNPKALASSLILQGAIVASLMLIGTNDAIRTKLTRMTVIAPPAILKPSHPKTNQGGGGGQHSPLPPLKGQLPKPAPRVFTPPLVTIEHAALVIDPSLLAPLDAWAAPTGNIGNPFGVVGGLAGPGNHGGIGGGTSVGIGDKDGIGVGAENGSRIFSVGNGTTQPEVLTRVDPEYSEEARKARYSGSVTLSIVVDTDGRAEDIRVVRSLGMGLDEKAVEAVQKWRFRPGTNRGLPVRVRAQILVSFRLL